MSWPEWVDIASIKILFQHASAVATAILLFKGIAILVAWGFPQGLWRTILESTDTVVLVGLVIWFAYQMGCLFWKERVRIGSAKCILVA
jgi:hypothetical protein